MDAKDLVAESGERDLDDEELERVERIADAKDSILEQVRKKIYGQSDLIEHMLIALFSRGHSLLMGVPGLAKTSMVQTLASVLDLDFNRIQFTPDLMPADITGTDILEEDAATGERHFKFMRGPVFTNLLLADEINRTPPKTQAALLQAMQE
ncbi:MAG: AAA family ATPase, partial [Bradymonadaceae bacterium]